MRLQWKARADAMEIAVLTGKKSQHQDDVKIVIMIVKWWWWWNLKNVMQEMKMMRQKHCDEMKIVRGNDRYDSGWEGS